MSVWLETHGDFATADAARGLLEQAGGEGLGLVWDPANAFSEFGEQPEPALAALGPLVRHVHLKDVRRPPDGRVPWPPALPGEGDFPGARALAALAGAGYDGWVSFEWEKRWHPEIEEPEAALPRFVRWAADALRGRRDPRPAGARLVHAGRLRVEVYPERPALGAAAARVVADELRRSIARDGRAVAIFASAPSQNEFLAALRAASGIDWPKVVAFHLDEYVGVSADHPASFRRFLVDRLFAHVPVGAFHGLEGRARDLEAECDRYAALLALSTRRRSSCSGSARTGTSRSSTRRCATSRSRATCASSSSTSPAAPSRCTTGASRGSRTCRGRASRSPCRT